MSDVVRVTPAALELVLAARESEESDEDLALWLEVNGVGPSGWNYDLYFQARGDAGGKDQVVDLGKIAVVVPSTSVDKLRGSTLDVEGEGEDAGLVLLNPNTPPKAPSQVSGGLPPGVPVDLDSDVARHVAAILEEEINPAIAMHGGAAELVSVHEGLVYLRLQGGCQGCGLASVTLSQGIEVALKENVPEVVGVVDVTDHESGTDPFFTSAKK
jgi:Fe/S biogenesis protein NfuA